MSRKDFQGVKIDSLISGIRGLNIPLRAKNKETKQEGTDTKKRMHNTTQYKEDTSLHESFVVVVNQIIFIMDEYI